MVMYLLAQHYLQLLPLQCEEEIITSLERIDTTHFKQVTIIVRNIKDIELYE